MAAKAVELVKQAEQAAYKTVEAAKESAKALEKKDGDALLEKIRAEASAEAKSITGYAEQEAKKLTAKAEKSADEALSELKNKTEKKQAEVVSGMADMLF